MTVPAQTVSGVLAVCGSLMALSVIAVVLRFYTRKHQRLAIQADDVFAVLALLFYLGAASIVIRDTQIGTIGWTMATMTRQKELTLLKVGSRLDLSYNVLIALTFGCIKLSALFFYKRVLCIDGLRRFVDYLIIGTVVLVVLQTLTYVIFPFVQCGAHLSLMWTAGHIPEKMQYCVPLPYSISWVTSNLILDIWILILPVRSIVRLDIPTMKKFSIAGVFLLAFAGLGASIVRTVLYYRIFYGGEAYSLHHDSGLANTEVAYFSMLEAGLSLVAVNLPTLWYLFTTVVPEKAQRGLRSPWSDGSIGSKNSNRLGHEKHSAAVRETQIATKKDHISTYDSDSNGALHLPPFMGDLEAGAHQPPSTRHV